MIVSIYWILLLLNFLNILFYRQFFFKDLNFASSERKEDKIDPKEIAIAIKVLNNFQIESKKKLEKLENDLISNQVCFNFFFFLYN